MPTATQHPAFPTSPHQGKKTRTHKNKGARAARRERVSRVSQGLEKPSGLLASSTALHEAAHVVFAYLLRPSALQVVTVRYTYLYWTLKSAKPAQSRRCHGY
jgi:hypothetical protein